MALPTGWAAMSSTSFAADIIKFAAGTWQWAGAPTALLGTSNATGTGKFGFTVYRNHSGGQVLTANFDRENRDVVFGGKLRWLIVVDNPAAVADYTLPRLHLELYALSYATVNPLPLVSSPLFGGRFGTITGATNLTEPRVINIQYEQVAENDPSRWNMVFTIDRDRRSASSQRPKTGNKPTKPNAEEAPWSVGATYDINWGAEDFTLGIGRFIAAKTPAELDAALQADTYAALFSGTGAAEMIANSAGDPLESPPPMKVSNASISVHRAFETLPAGLAAKIQTATEQVCSAAVTIGGVAFAAHTCKLVGGGVVLRRWKKQCDWLPKQKHPLDWTYEQVGWTPPTGAAASDVAVNYTRNALPAFEYVDYHDVSLSIAQRKLGWGHALVDKGFRKKVNGQVKEITDFPGRQSYQRILAEGAEVDLTTGTTDKKVLRLYQVLETGTALNDVLAEIFPEEPEE